jgi:hypothetical protein
VYRLFEEMTKNEYKRRRKRRMLIEQFRRNQTHAKLHLLKVFDRRGLNRSTWKLPDLHVHTSALWEVSVPLFSEETFQQKFRLTRSTFNMLVKELSPILQKQDTNFRAAIPVSKRIGIALYYLKSNSSADVVSDVFKVGTSTVNYLVHEFCDAVNTILFKKYVVFPHSLEEKKDIAKDFFTRWQFPNTFGSLDGTHIPIISPPDHPEDYFNYKNYHSIVLLALVDAHGKFIYTNIGTPGRANDASIFNDCPLKAKLQEDELIKSGLHIIGDGAFPLMPTLMKPYIITPQLPIDREHFNRRLSRARVVVEDAFGRLKGRFRILMKRADLKVDSVCKIIKTCVTLHNICEVHKEQYLTTWDDALKDYSRRYEQPVCDSPENKDLSEGKLKRDELCSLISSDAYTFQS